MAICLAETKKGGVNAPHRLEAAAYQDPVMLKLKDGLLLASPLKHVVYFKMTYLCFFSDDSGFLRKY